MEGLGFAPGEAAHLRTLTEDVVRSSQIEGENLGDAEVRSSIARRLGLDVAGLVPSSRAVDGVVEMMLDATQRYSAPLDEGRLFGWHAALFPTGRSGMRPIRVGAWRDDAAGPMQVVSGPLGRERVHYEAPGATRLPGEMAAFFTWYNRPPTVDPLLFAAQAHLWFVTAHPFEDGNGRIARAVADQALARADRTEQRYYSMTAQIHQDRSEYYAILEEVQRGSLDITPWIDWFIRCLDRAFDRAEAELASVMAKARFWSAPVVLNERQRLVLNRLLDGFEGKLTSSKWAKLAKCSQDTALRDIDDLVRRGVLVKDPAGGRSTSYSLAGV